MREVGALAPTRGMLVAAALAAALLAQPGCTADETKVEQYRAEALQEREAGNLDTARILLRQALSLAPTDAGINLELARTLQQLDRTGDAAFYFGEAYRLDPSLTEAALALAPLLYDSDPDRARELVDEVIEREPDNGRAYARRAELLLVESELEEALEAALLARELAPDDVLAHRMVGTVYRVMIQDQLRAGQEEPSDDLFQKALEATRRAREIGSHPWVDLTKIAHIYTDWPGHEQEAKQSFREAFEAAREAESEDGMRRIAAEAQQKATALGDRELVEWALERRLEVDPDRVLGWQRLAEAAEGREEGSGEAVWQRALDELPDDPGIQVGYASYLGSRGRADEAVEHLESLPPETLRSPEVSLMLVKVHAARDRLEEARAALRRMRKDQGGESLASVAEARIAMAEGDLEGAADQLRSVADELERTDVYRLLAEVEAARGNMRNALAAVNRAIDTSGVPPVRLYRMRNRLLAGQREWEELLRSLGEMRREGPGWGPPERIQLVHANYRLGRAERGRRLLERLLEQEPPSPGAVRTFASYEGRRQPERARELLQAALERQPGSARLAARLAQLELALGRPDAALESLASLGDPSELQPALRLVKARALAGLDRWDEAEAEARAAFESEPRPRMAARIFARTLEAQNRLDEAVTALEEARSDQRLSGNDLWMLGRLYLDTGDLENARVVLEEAVGASPDLAGARNDLAFVLAETGEDLDRALDLARQAKSALPESAAVGDTLGRVYQRRGMLEPAVSEFRSAIDLAGEDGGEQLRADLHVRLALALEELGRTEEALRAVEEALEIRPDHERALGMREQLAATGGTTGAGS